MLVHNIKPLFKPSIDKFIDNLSDDVKDKLCKTIDALRSEFDLSGLDKFKIPFDKFEKNKLSNEDSKAILINLHKNNILKVTSKLKISYKPDKFSVKTIIEESDIYTYPNTEIALDKDKFIYLETKLKKITHPELSMDYLLKIENLASNTNCIIGKNSLKLIAPKIDSLQSLKSNEELGRFLIECGVKKELCIGLFIDSAVKPPSVSDVYSAENILQTATNPAPLPNFEKYSRAQFIYRIMLFYSCSEHKKKEILFKIIEDASHPLLFNADKKASEIFQEGLNLILEFDGYCLENGKIEKIKFIAQKEALEKNGSIELILEYNEKTREIKINNILLARPNFNSPNHSLFEFLYERNEQLLNKKEILSTLKLKPKEFGTFLNEINIKGTIRKYIVSLSKKNVQLHKKVSITDKNDINEIKKELQKLKNKKVEKDRNS
ncbi:MAG: hypothetical protein EOM84_00500 [Sphingobacteriia bacterium]|nr:hypothetical protein [Sphingobacteriia bacterium]